MNTAISQPTYLEDIDVCISAGHSTNPKRDRGAQHPTNRAWIEGVLSARMRDKIILRMNKRGYKCKADGDDTILADSIKYFTGKTTEKTILVDIHFNAASETVKGIETLVPSVYTQTELSIAAKVSAIYAKHTGSPLRGNALGKPGVKTEAESHHGKLGWMRIQGHNILVESEFITNATAMKIYESKEDLIADDLAALLIEEALKLQLNDKVSNSTATNFYVVKAGDSLSKIAIAHKTSVAELQQINNIKNVAQIQIGQRIKLK